ncbi:MAG: hypothetical protein WAK01_04630 [Methylocystis sp.]
MTPTEKLKSDIETLRESIKVDGIVFEILGLTPDDRAGILEHMGECLSEIQELKSQLRDKEAIAERTSAASPT